MSGQRRECFAQVRPDGWGVGLVRPGLCSGCAYDFGAFVFGERGAHVVVIEGRLEYVCADCCPVCGPVSRAIAAARRLPSPLPGGRRQ